jgi:hypothetical protein
MPFDETNDHRTKINPCKALARLHAPTTLTVSVLYKNERFNIFTKIVIQCVLVTSFSVTHKGCCHFLLPINLFKPPKPTLPVINPKSPIVATLRSIQKYIIKFQYNYTGKTFVPLRKDKGMKHLVFSAKEIMRACLPIQCVESVFIAVYLTNGIDRVSDGSS